MAWTVPRTWVTGELVTATIGNSAWRDNLAYLKDAPTFDGAPTVTGNLTLTAALISNSATDATSTLTGAIQTDGGLGVVKALWVGGLTNIAGALTLQAALVSDSTTDSTSITTGAIQTDGGLGVAKALWVGGLANVAGAVTLQSTLAVARTATITDSSDETLLSLVPTHATLTATVAKVNTTRAANSAFTLIDLQANSVSQFKVSGDGLITAAGLGTHTLSGGANSSQTLMLANTTSGTAASSGFQTQAGGTINGTFRAFSAGFTTAGSAIASSARVNCDGSGGMVVSASNAAGSVFTYAGGTAAGNLVMTAFASGGVSIGDTTDPGDTNFRVAGTSTLVGAITLTGGVSGQLSITDTANESVLVVQPTHASFTGNAIFANTTRAANSAFNLLRLDANSVNQFTVSGAGVATMNAATIAAGQVSVTDANNESVLTVMPTHATYTGNAIFANTTRAANSAFNLLRLDANSVAQFTVTGAGSVTAAGTLTVTTAGGNVTWGTYTPTLTNVTNVDSSTASLCRYMRVGNHVIVHGSVAINTTAAAGTATALQLSLPVASNFTTGTDLSGTGGGYTVNTVVQLSANASDVADLAFLSQTTANEGYFFTFQYVVQ